MPIFAEALRKGHGLRNISISKILDDVAWLDANYPRRNTSKSFPAIPVAQGYNSWAEYEPLEDQKSRLTSQLPYLLSLRTFRLITFGIASLLGISPDNLTTVDMYPRREYISTYFSGKKRIALSRSIAVGLEREAKCGYVLEANNEVIRVPIHEVLHAASMGVWGEYDRNVEEGLVEYRARHLTRALLNSQPVSKSYQTEVNHIESIEKTWGTSAVDDLWKSSPRARRDTLARWRYTF
jgi:hypothetical protein